MQITVDKTFELAIAAELAAHQLFEGLTAKFAEEREVADLWVRLATDETHHAEWLHQLKAKLTPEQLQNVVDADTTSLLQAVGKISVERALASIKNLDDAYHLVNEIENGETNAIFQFLLNNFEMDVALRDFLRNQLNLHIARLTTDLPDKYSSSMARKAVKAK